MATTTKNVGPLAPAEKQKETEKKTESAKTKLKANRSGKKETGIFQVYWMAYEIGHLNYKHSRTAVVQH